MASALSSFAVAFLVIVALSAVLSVVFCRDEIRAILICRRNGWRPKAVARTNGKTEWYGIDIAGQWHKLEV